MNPAINVTTPIAVVMANLPQSEPSLIAPPPDNQHLGGPELIAQASAPHRTLGAKDHPQPARVRHPQGPLGSRVSHRPMTLDPVHPDPVHLRCPSRCVG